MTQEWISEFTPTSEDEWKAQLLKELKGDDSKLVTYNKIEEITHSSFYYPSSNNLTTDQTLSIPVQRGFMKSNNQWRNGIQISTTNEIEANKKALHALMSGCDFIHFVSNANTNWNVVLNEVGLSYIHTTFTIKNSSDIHDLIQVIGQENLSYCSFDLFEDTISNIEIKNLIKSVQFPVIQIDGFSLNQCGANSIQELSFVTQKAHLVLLKLMNLGLTIDEAAACIHFRMGVGSNYLIEIAKFRSLKILWANLLKAYNPLHNCTLNCQITAEVGWVNKSLKDPHTNLLRQTTEAMSAILGGIDRLIVHPYDSCSKKGTSNFSERMALNISNLLQDESYFSSIADAIGGSYAIESLTNELANKSWDLFKEIDVLPVDLQNLEWENRVMEKATQRIEMLRNSETTYIGINKFHNPQINDNEWLLPKSFQNLSYLRLETEI